MSSIRSREGPADAKALHATFSMRIGPKLLLAILWHQHQPMYRDCTSSVAKNSFMLPWVRLHCIRDYYSVAALLTSHPNVHLTINLTPVLLRQIENYVEVWIY
jgi:alpha-amylase/alpha-mannosidase (GH57 family)